MSNQINSKRMFAVVFIEGESTYSNPAVKLHEIYPEGHVPMGSQWEWHYAIQDNIDEVLDLKPGERLQMNFNRDNADSAGFIKRIV